MCVCVTLSQRALGTNYSHLFFNTMRSPDWPRGLSWVPRDRPVPVFSAATFFSWSLLTSEHGKSHDCGKGSRALMVCYHSNGRLLSPLSHVLNYGTHSTTHGLRIRGSNTIVLDHNPDAEGVAELSAVSSTLLPTVSGKSGTCQYQTMPWA